MSNSINTLQCHNQLSDLESIKHVQYQDLINFIENELVKINKPSRSLSYAIKTESLNPVNNMPEALKKQILKKYRYFNVEHDWYDKLLNHWFEKLKIYGFNNIEIIFTGFRSQKDGVSFTAEVDLKIYLKAHKLGNKYRATLSAVKDGMVNAEVYNVCPQHPHEYIISTRSKYIGNNTTVREQLNLLNEKILKEVQYLSRKIYRSLKNDYNYLLSNILETLKENGYICKHKDKFPK